MIKPDMLPSEYLSYYSKKSTFFQKTSGLKRYLSIVTAEEITDLDAQWVAYIQKGKDQITHDLMRYPTLPEVKAMSPTTQRQYLSSAECYLADCCGITLTNLQQRLRKRSLPSASHPLTRDAEPTREMVRAVLAHCDERATAEILLALSGGLRIGEIVGLHHRDIELDHNPILVHIRAEIAKNGCYRHTFISAEAGNALKSYYRVRDVHISIARNRMGTLRPDYEYDQDRIFPFSAQSERRRLNNAIQDSGHAERDPNTNRRRVHFHLFRKMFLTEGKRVAAPEYVEAWAGHTGYLANAYHRPTAEQEAKEYQKVEAAVTVNVPDDYEKIKVEQAGEIANLQQTNTHLLAQITALKAEFEEMQREQERITVAQISGLPRRLPHDDPDVSDM